MTTQGTRILSEGRVMTIRVALFGSLISIATTASADYVCSVSLGLSWSQDADYDQLIIREGALGYELY